MLVPFIGEDRSAPRGGEPEPKPPNPGKEFYEGELWLRHASTLRLGLTFCLPFEGLVGVS